MIKEGYTRVSEVVGWYKTIQLSKIDPETLKKKTELGSEVHEAIEGYYSGVFAPLPEKGKGYFESFKLWNDSTNPNIICQEQRYYNDNLMLTGAVDMILQEGDRRIIIDFKTSASIDRDGWSIQGSCYHHLDGGEADIVRFVKLDKDGKKPTFFDFVPNADTWDLALQCLMVYRFWNKK